MLHEGASPLHRGGKAAESASGALHEGAFPLRRGGQAAIGKVRDGSAKLWVSSIGGMGVAIRERGENLGRGFRVVIL